MDPYQNNNLETQNYNMIEISFMDTKKSLQFSLHSLLNAYLGKNFNTRKLMLFKFKRFISD